MKTKSVQIMLLIMTGIFSCLDGLCQEKIDWNTDVKESSVEQIRKWVYIDSEDTTFTDIKMKTLRREPATTPAEYIDSLFYINPNMKFEPYSVSVIKRFPYLIVYREVSEIKQLIDSIKAIRPETTPKEYWSYILKRPDILQNNLNFRYFDNRFQKNDSVFKKVTMNTIVWRRRTVVSYLAKLPKREKFEQWEIPYLELLGIDYDPSKIVQPIEFRVQ
jgi:hypothetical protein